MKSQLIDIPFPLQGLHVASALASQPPNTTPSALNVRGYNPRLGRDQGGMRSGLTKYTPTQVAGTAPIQDVNSCVSTNVAISSVPFAGALALQQTTAVGMEIYNNGGVNKFFDTSDTCLGVAWDNDNARAFGAMTTGSATKITAGKPDGTALWTSTTLPQFNASQQVGVAYGNGFVWIATRNSGSTATFVYKLDPGTGAILNGGTHIYTSSRVINQGSLSFYNGILAIGMTSGFVEYLNVNSLTVTPVQLIVSPNVNDIDTDGNGFFYVVFANNTHVVKTDTAGNIIWNVTIPASTANSSVCYDPINNVVAVSGAFGGVGKLQILNPSTGAINTSFQVLGATICSCVRPSGLGGYAVTDTAGGNIGNVTSTGSTVWSAGIANLTGGSRAIAAYQGPSVTTLKNLGLHYIRGIAVAGGTVVRLISGSGNVAVTNGSAALNSAATVIFSDQQGQQLYFADGVNYKYYDGLTDSVLTLTASSGSLPKDNQGNAARLVCVYRNRLVFSGLRFDPLNWFMSAVGDPTNWNYNTSPPVETEAVAGNNSTAGQAPDIINSLVPYNNEILFFLCSDSIWQMTGDPIAGGRLDLVASGVGGAFGKPWCRDGQGIIYFTSSRGSVYRMMPGGIPERISDPIAELVATIQTGNNIVRMEWQERHFGFHLYITPTQSATVTQHYFFDTRNQSWWQDQLGSTNFDPIATHAMDGDTPGERVVLLGCRDGFVRKVDPAAVDDDGTAISSYVFMGPVRNQGFHGLTVSDLQCSLDNTSGNVTYDMFAGSDAQAALNGVSRSTGTFKANRNPSQAVRVFGHSHWVKLSSTVAWQLEWMKAKPLIPEGKARQRIFT